jgi:hypothetical protein
MIIERVKEKNCLEEFKGASNLNNGSGTWLSLINGFTATIFE